MGLDWWKLSLVWDRADQCELGPGDGQYSCLAHTAVQWPYLIATLTFHLPGITEKSDKDLEAAVVHELCHVFVNEMRCADEKHPDDLLRHNLEHEERVVSSLAQAFLWVREEGAHEAKRVLKKIIAKKSRRRAK